jgi:prepilin-type N-terminal cleavage/methylation domain-containing protein
MKKAFTMLELIMVIVVIGILTAVIVPRVESTSLREAATQVVSHVQYTQHLAMVDDKFNSDEADWFVARWQIYFQLDTSGSGNRVYSIYTDKDLNDAANPNDGEMAVDPLSRKQMTGKSNHTNRIEEMDLTSYYGINNVDTTGCAGGVQRIFFDHLGRPHINNNSLYNNLLTEQCEIILFNSDGNISIFIEPETGYAHL